MKRLYSFAAVLLAPLVAAYPALAESSTANVPVDSLQIRVLEDRTAAISPGTHVGHAFAVQVTDAAGSPVKEAAVVFRLPESGPSGKFADGSIAAVTYTDATGKSDAGEITWGSQQGTVPIRVTAAKGVAHAGAIYEQSLVTAVPADVHLATSATPHILAVSAATPVLETRATPSVAIEKYPAKQSARPGALARDNEAPVYSGAARDDMPDANIPVRHALGISSASEVPSVSIESSGAASSGGHRKAIWITVIAVAAAAGAALAFTHGGGSSSGSASGISVGAPTVSVGHP